jgi:hypothetical protein
MQTAERRPTRAGVIRRFLAGDGDGEVSEERLVPATRPSVSRLAEDVIDLRPFDEPDLQLLHLRLDRLEAGVRLVAETMKRAFGEVASSLDELRDSPPADLERLTEAVRGFPMIMAAAADHLDQRMEIAKAQILESVKDVVRLVDPALAAGSSTSRAIWGHEADVDVD